MHSSSDEPTTLRYYGRATDVSAKLASLPKPTQAPEPQRWGYLSLSLLLSPSFTTMLSSTRSPLLLLLLAFAAILGSTIAETLPNDIVVVIPANGTIANSTDGVSTYSLDNTGRAGDYLQNVILTLTYPNGTSSPGGGVSSGGCITRSGFYTFGFNNSQAGDYVSGASDSSSPLAHPPSRDRCSRPRLRSLQR